MFALLNNLSTSRATSNDLCTLFYFALALLSEWYPSPLLIHPPNVSPHISPCYISSAMSLLILPDCLFPAAINHHSPHLNAIKFRLCTLRSGSLVQTKSSHEHGGCCNSPSSQLKNNNSPCPSGNNIASTLY